MATNMAPAIAAVLPQSASVVVPDAANAAATTTMAGEAGSFMRNPRYMQSWDTGGQGRGYGNSRFSPFADQDLMIGENAEEAPKKKEHHIHGGGKQSVVTGRKKGPFFTR